MIRYARIPIINISERNETIRRFFDANNAKTRANITNPNLDAPKKKKKKKKKKEKPSQCDRRGSILVSQINNMMLHIYNAVDAAF